MQRIVLRRGIPTAFALGFAASTPVTAWSASCQNTSATLPYPGQALSCTTTGADGLVSQSAAGAYAWITQTGQNNAATVTQTSPGAWARVVQSGSGNVATIRQG